MRVMIITTLKNRTFHICAVLLFGVMLSLFPVQAQIAKPGYEDKLLFRGITGVTLGGNQTLWQLKGFRTINQQTAPISFAVPLSNRILLSAANYGAITSSDTTKVQGLADTRVSLSYVLPGDRFWLTAGASIPTGKTKLETDELAMMSIMSQNAFGYKVPVFGQGFNMNFGIAYATPLTRRLVMGVGTSYIFRGSYEPISNSSTKYDAGDEVTSNIGIDYIAYSKTSRFSLDASFSYFFEDKLNSEKKFQSGSRIMLFGVYSLKAEKLNHQISTRVRYRLQNTSFNDSSSIKYNAGTQLDGQYTLSSQLNSWSTGVAVVGIKLYSADQLPIGQDIVETGKAQIISVGGDLLFHFSEILTPTLSLRYSTGDITLEDEEYDVSGFEIGLGLKVSF